MGIEIKKAKYLGTCFGVDRALEITYNALESSDMVYSYGDLIHNDDVKKELEDKGLIVIDKIEDIDKDKSTSIILRSHGVGEWVYKKAEENNLEIIDATCPKVKKIHKIVKDCYNKGYDIIIFGNENHPEIKGIKGWSENKGHIFKDLEDFKSQINNFDFINNKFAIVFQTTYNIEKYKKIEDFFKKYNNIKFYNTICSATEKRQKACRNIAKEYDTMIVIGGKHSSNTRKLYEISKEFCKNTIWIENKSEIPYNYIKNSKKIGITAGASTPLLIIEEVIECLKKIK